MISIGEISVQPDEIEFSNNNIKLKINNGEFERGELIFTKK